MSVRDLVRESVGHTVSRRRLLALIGAGSVGSVLGSSSGAAQTTGGPIELDQLVAGTSATTDTLDVDALTGPLVARREVIDNIDCPIAVDETLSADEYLVINEPGGTANSNLTALYTASAGSWTQADNARFFQNGSVAQNFDDDDIYVGRGGEWVPIDDAGPAIPDSDANNQWHFNGGSGTLVEDHIGSLDANFGSLSWASDTGAYGYYADLDGSIADLGQAGEDSLSHWTEENEGTFFCWVNPDDVSNFQGIFGGGPGTDTVGVYLDIQSTGRFRFLLGDGNGSEQVTTGSLSTNTWYAFAGVADGSTLSAYVGRPNDYDLTEEGSEPVPGTTNSSWTYTPHFGTNPDSSGSNFDGGLGISFSDNVPWSVSDLQDFVDETAPYYD